MEEKPVLAACSRDRVGCNFLLIGPLLGKRSGAFPWTNPIPPLPLGVALRTQLVCHVTRVAKYSFDIVFHVFHNALPGSPPLGVEADMWVFLCIELVAVLALVLLVYKWARTGPHLWAALDAPLTPLGLWHLRDSRGAGGQGSRASSRSCRPNAPFTERSMDGNGRHPSRGVHGSPLSSYVVGTSLICQRFGQFLPVTSKVSFSPL
jgi:Domain of unknown function (DUF4436)